MKSMLTVTLHYTPDLVRRAVFAYLYRGFSMRGRVALAGLIVGTLLLFVFAPGSWEAGAAAGAVAVLVLLVIALYRLHYRQGMAKLERMRSPSATLDLTDAEFRVIAYSGTVSAPWSRITDLWRFTDFWLLIIGNGQFMTLPMADLTDEAKRFIASHIGASGKSAV
ncbi:MAG: YcxB family protein [Geobacteraceae bacterium]|nr:YcxB family protein [Geobacteraceae bacterium]